MKFLVLGLGNSLHSDDAIGLFVVRRIRELLEDRKAHRKSVGAQPAVNCVETEEMGLALLDFLSGYDRAIIVDAVQTGKVPPGSLHIFKETDLKNIPGTSPHYSGISEALALGRALELPMPRDVTIFAVEVKDPFSIGTQMSPELNEAAPRVASHIVTFLNKMMEGAADRK